MRTESGHTGRFTTAVRQASFISLAAILLGFSYTALMKKGFFIPPEVKHTGTIAPVFVSYEEAVQLFDAGNALFVDARHAFDYKLGHIKGAVNVPLADFDLQESALANVQRDRIIVTYCDGAECNSSIDLAKLLSSAGFTQVKMFFGGWNEWQSNSRQLEKAP